MNRKILILAVFLAAPLAAKAEAIPTFSEDVAPIVFAKCTSCHRPGEAAPFAFMNYRDVQKRGRLIAKVVKTGFMPPWHAESKDFHFSNNRKLSVAEIETFEKWVAGGMPPGDAAKTPAVPTFAEGWQLGEPDLVVKMTEAYTLHAEGPDIYRNFVIPLDTKEEQWIRAIEFRPGARSVVHHCLYYYDTTGTARRLDAAEKGTGFRRLGKEFRGNSVGGWAVGGTPQMLPEGLAYKLPKGSDLVLSTHFHPSGKEESEISTVGIYFSDEPPEQGFSAVQLPPVFGALAGVMIPAGDPNYRKTDSFVLPVAVKAFGVSAHAHYLGKSLDMFAFLPNGKKKEMLVISDWDFSWQEEYRYAKPVLLPKGTRLEASVVWDNSEDNIYNPNSPPKPVRWGRESDDEMGCVTLMVVAADPSELSVLKDDFRGHIRKAASQAVANRFAGSGQQRGGNLLKKIMERFDRNGDGKLSDQERAEARKFYRGNRF
jgi:hypothetical protein